MAGPFLDRLRRGWVRILGILFAVDTGPSNLAESVADQLFAGLAPAQRILLRQRFGVGQQTNVNLEEIAWPFSATRRRIRGIESQALIRLYRWEARKFRLPAVQRRLVQRIAIAHHEILDVLCDAPPIRSVLVGWHDQLVDGRRPAGEIAEPPDPVIPDGPEEEMQSSELVLAATLRKALWAHARGRKAARQRDEEQAGHEDERAKALEALREIRFNAQSILALAEALLGHARRIPVESDEPIPRLLDPAVDKDASAPPDFPPGSVAPWAGELPNILERDSVLADVITAESGMPVGELWERAARIDKALAKARHNLRLLVDSGMPMVAEVAVTRSLRGDAFVDSIERGRTALLNLTDRFCFTAEGDFTVLAEEAVHAALEALE
jgi:hypothetical protein